MCTVKQKKSNYYIFAAFLIIISIWSFQSFKHFEYNWDLIPYMGCVYKTLNGEMPIKEIHQLVYKEIEKKVTAEIYQDLIGAEKNDFYSEYRAEVYHDPDVFRQQLTYYNMRFSYIYLISIIFSLTNNIILSFAIISIFSFICTGILITWWFHRYFNNWITFFTILLFLFWRTFLMESARYATPDALVHFLTILALFLIIERKQLHFGSIVLLFSITVRPDNAILALFFFFSCL